MHEWFVDLMMMLDSAYVDSVTEERDKETKRAKRAEDRKERRAKSKAGGGTARKRRW